MSGTAAPPVGLIDRPPGDVTQQPGGALFPSTPFEGQDWFGPTKMVGRGLDRLTAETGVVPGLDEYVPGVSDLKPEPTISGADANKQFGIPGHLSFANPVPPSVAQSMADAKHDELMREDAAARAPAGFFSSAARMGAGFVAGALDPLNVAASILPVVGEARVAGAVARAGIDGVAGTIATRGLTGMAAGAVGQAPLVALRYGLSQQEQADYTGADALADMAMGTALGGGLHVAGGFAGDLLGRRFGRSEGGLAAAADPDTREAAARTAIAQLATDRSVEVQPVLDAGLGTQGEAPAGLGEELAPPLGRTSRPVSLTGFLVRNGGLLDQGGDLEAMNARTARPGLVSGRGMPLDRAREAAEEAGYLPPNSTISDLLDGVSEELSGRRVYAGGDAAEAHIANQDRLAGVEQARLQDARDEITGLAQEAGVTLQPAELDHAALLSMQGVHPEDALHEAARAGDLDMSETFDRAARAATDPLPAEPVSPLAAAAAKAPAPRLMDIDQNRLADAEDFLARTRAAEALPAGAEAEVARMDAAAAKSQSWTAALKHAAACLMAGVI